MLLYYQFIFYINLAIFNVVVCTKGQSSESIVKPLQETDACRYKVWYLEICDPTTEKQVVHLILAEGGNNCEIVRHLTKDCKPSKENDHPVMPQKAAFKELLLSKNHSLQALEETIDQTDTEELPSLLKPGSSKLRESEATLLTEIKDFERQEDKTLQNMEDTLSHTRITSTPMDVTANDEDDVIRTTPNPAISSRRSIVEEVTDDGAIQEMEFIADEENEQAEDDLVDLKHIEQELLKKDLNKPMIVQDELEPIEPKVGPAEVPRTQPPESRQPMLHREKVPINMVTQAPYDVTAAAQDDVTYKQIQMPTRKQSKYYGQRNLNLDEQKKTPNWEEEYKKPMNWKEKQNWVEKRFKDLELSEAMNMSEMFRNQLGSKNSTSNSKIINWMIKNMPDGKQTIIVL